MKGSARLRGLASYALVAVLAFAVASCNEAHPNTTLVPHSDLGREIDFLWDRLLLLGTIVFILVEGALVYIVFKYRRRDNQAKPPQTHGSTKLEITWTLIPAVILVFIAVPTVKTIFITQAQAAPGSLNIDVTGHQWWWEFRYPEYGVTTANEIYVPVGRTVNFRLRSADVIHSFWTPQLGGKRDVITNRSNYLWYTPDSSTASHVWNGFCVEYCGASHANMRFRVFTVTPAQFESWVAGQKLPARFGAVGPVAPTGGPIPPPLEAPGVTTPGGPNAPSQAAQAAAQGVAQRSSGTGTVGGTQPALPRGQNPEANPGAQTGVPGVTPSNANFASTSPVPPGSPRKAGFLGRCLHRLSFYRGKPDCNGRDRPKPYSCRLEEHNRGWSVPEYGRVFGALDQERTRNEARSADAYARDGRIRSCSQSESDVCDGRTDRPADRRHRCLPNCTEVTGDRLGIHRISSTGARTSLFG